MTDKIQSRILIVQLHSAHFKPEMAAMLHLPRGVSDQNPELLTQLDNFQASYLLERMSRLRLPADDAVEWVIFAVDPPQKWLQIPTAKTGVAVLELDRSPTTRH